METLREKCIRDESDFNKVGKSPNRVNEYNLDQENACGNKAPFWWNEQQTLTREDRVLSLDRNRISTSSKTTEREILRWQEEPDIVQITAFKDPCERREELAM